MECPFCDTRHEDGILMSDDEILRAVQLYSADWIVLTGGEPALWIDEAFVRLLKRATGKKVAIETNGTVRLPSSIDWVTVSPKNGICGSSTFGEENECEEPGRVIVDRADEIKVVDLGQSLDQYFDLPCIHDKTLMYLQPCYVADEVRFAANRLSTVRRVLADPRWTLSVQLHRYLGIP